MCDFSASSANIAQPTGYKAIVFLALEGIIMENVDKTLNIYREMIITGLAAPTETGSSQQLGIPEITPAISVQLPAPQVSLLLSAQAAHEQVSVSVSFLWAAINPPPPLFYFSFTFLFFLTFLLTALESNIKPWICLSHF